MPTTPLRGWTYPSEGQNPYYPTIVGLFEAQDADVDAIADTVANGVIAPTIVDAKGDLIVATAADTVARLAVGTADGQVLLVDAAQASGMRWGRTGYRVSLLGASTVVSNTTAETSFSKTLPVPANILGVVGAQVDVTARVLGSASVASSMVLDPVLCGCRLGYIGVAMSVTADQDYSYIASGVVRAIGVSGQFVGGPSIMGPPLNNDLRMGTTFTGSGAVEGLNTTAAGALVMRVTFSVANVGITAQLQSMMLKITYPDATVA